jgi:hypothetical protein
MLTTPAPEQPRHGGGRRKSLVLAGLLLMVAVLRPVDGVVARQQGSRPAGAFFDSRSTGFRPVVFGGIVVARTHAGDAVGTAPVIWAITASSRPAAIRAAAERSPFTKVGFMERGAVSVLIVGALTCLPRPRWS